MSTSQPSRSMLSRLDSLGLSCFPPLGMATLIAAQHMKPLQLFPLSFAPLLLFSGYVNLSGWAIDSAGMTAAWSGIYVLLALRRRQPSLIQKFTARGIVRGTTIGLGAVNSVAGGVAYVNGDRAKETAERKARNRWAKKD